MARFDIGSLELITCFIARFNIDLEVPFQKNLDHFFDVEFVVYESVSCDIFF